MLKAELAQLDRDGFTVLPSVFSPVEVADMIRRLVEAFAAADASVLRSARAIYGARNVSKLWPGVLQAWRKPLLVDFVRDVLGPEAGLVRVLFFDKPPEQSWALPFHQDMTIAVRDNRVASTHFTHPTTKASVPHLEAPRSLLERMLTLRIHLDPMTEDNGPLSLMPGSHRAWTPDGGRHSGVTPLGPAGDVLAMRPLVAHGSRSARAGTELHRRILHVELAGVRTLPDGVEWHEFTSV